MNGPRRAPAPGGSPSSPRRAARARELERYRKIQRKKALRRAGFFASRVLLFYLVFLILAGAYFLIKLNRFPQKELPGKNVFLVDTKQEDYSNVVKGKLYRKADLLGDEGVLLAPALMDRYCELAEGGDHAVRMIYLDGVYARFWIGTPTVCINGEYTWLDQSSVIRDGQLCVSMEFFDRCLNGITVTDDADNDRWIVDRDGTPGFAFKAPVPSDPISYEDLTLRIESERAALEARNENG